MHVCGRDKGLTVSNPFDVVTYGEPLFKQQVLPCVYLSYAAPLCAAGIQRELGSGEAGGIWCGHPARRVRTGGWRYSTLLPWFAPAHLFG